MQSPKATPNSFQERAGVLAVAQQVNRLQLIWRETPNTDVGIDGQIEFVSDEGECTGHIVAAQIKSGASFIKRSGDQILFYPEDKHIKYWRDFAVPVLLFLHDPTSAQTYWIDARQWLRAGKGSPIRLSTAQTLAATPKQRLFETVAPLMANKLEADGLPRYLASAIHRDPGFKVSFLELFILGLTDSCRKLFFSMELAMEIAEYRARKAGVGWSVGGVEHRFIDGYISWLVEQNIARIDYADYLFDRDELQLAPVFLAPLTDRGLVLRNTLTQKAGVDHCVYESSLVIADESRIVLPERFEKIDRLRQRLLSPS